MLRRTLTLLVCQFFAMLLFSSVSNAWDLVQAAAHTNHATFVSPQAVPHGTVPGTSPNKIVKCRQLSQGYGAPGLSVEQSAANLAGIGSGNSLPEYPTKGWELAGDVFFARTKGKVRFFTGIFWGLYGSDDVDLNADMGLDDHGVMGSFVATYRFRSKWALRYSVMPMLMNGSGQAGKSFMFGNTIFTAGQNVGIKWERLEQRFGLVYDAVRTHSSRLSVFSDYVRVTDRIKVTQTQFGMGTGAMDNDLNMAMAGISFEKCMKTTRTKATLTMECKASGAFLDDAVGMEAESALKYSIPMNCGRWGFVKGGYRYLTYKKKSSDARMFDIAMEGGFLQMGLVF